MKKNHIISILVLSVCTYITLSSFKTTGMHPSSTGGPGELGNCSNASTGCHAGATITNDNTSIVNTLIYSMSDSSYVPGQTYTVTVQAKKTGIVKMGFGIVALTTTGNNNAGSWQITDATSTHIIAGTGSLASRSYVTHAQPGTTTPYVTSGLGKWTFAWKAPSSDQGNIKFYYCTNCTNNNGANTGDALYLSSFQIHPKSTNAISEWINESGVSIAVDRSSHELLLNYQLMKDCELSVNLLDAQGKMVQKADLSNKYAGRNCDRINLVQDISSGIYLVNVNINNQTLTKKIMIQ